MTMADTKSISIPAELAHQAPFRFGALESNVRCIIRALEEGGQNPDEAASALELVADEISRLMSELDVCSWSDAPAKRMKAVANG